MSRQAYREGYDRIDWSRPLPPAPAKRRAPAKRSDFPTPMHISDFAEPVQSMADGKFYGSKAALARSHRAAHNPHGVDFHELGNEQPEFREHKTDERAERDTIRRAIHDHNDGWRPEVVALDD